MMNSLSTNLYQNEMRKGVQKLYNKGYFKKLYADENLPLNTVMPPAVLNSFSPNIITYMTSKKNINLLLGEYRPLGRWVDNWYGVRLLDNAGRVSDYGDNSIPPMVGANHSTTSIGHYRFEVGFNVGMLEDEQYRANPGAVVDIRQYKMDTCLQVTMECFHKIAIWGYIRSSQGNTDHDVYGILNYPRLNPMQTENKKIANMNYNEVHDFFNKYYTLLANTSGGYFTKANPLSVGMSIDDYYALDKIRHNNTGQPVSVSLRETYPNLTLIPISEFKQATSDNKDIMVFVAESKDISPALPTVELGYSKMLNFTDIVKGHTSYTGKVVSGTWGCIVYKPALVARAKFN